MLNSLRITNFLLIEQLELDFNSGFTVVTGETGSGKSIIVDGLMLVFGARATADVIRKEEDKATFEATFSTVAGSSINWLQNNDLLDVDDDVSIVCRRIIDRTGKNKFYINGHSVTATQMRALGELIVDIHTQHASITLLKPDMQRKLLDEYAGINGEVVKLNSIYLNIIDTQKKLKLARENSSQLERKRELLQEQIDDIANLNLQDGEWEDLQTRHKELSNAELILSELDFVQNMLNHENGALISNSIRLQTRLTKLSDILPKLSEQIPLMDSITTELQELNHEISVLASNIQQDSEQLSQVEGRISEIFTLGRKYRVSPENLSTTLHDWQEELASLKLAANQEELEKKLAGLEYEYHQLAKTISKERRIAADKLSIEVTKLLHQLAITGKFAIALKSQANLTAFGLEQVEYQVSFNAGMPLQSLARVASGGELSRCALALYLLLSIHNPPEIIVFDEIDVGIGGKVAAIIGKMLYDLGQAKQVICITHQAQAAGFGEYHLQVSKHTLDAITTTQVKYVAGEERISEIARMLSGMNVTATTREHAKEMLYSPSTI
jgi:DNA repair protein RecN (Recombination protein N)